LFETAKYTENIQKPDYQDNHYYGVKYAFDGSLHGDVGVHQPEEYSDDKKDDNYC
jgi:hypothetical protein